MQTIKSSALSYLLTQVPRLIPREFHEKIVSFTDSFKDLSSIWFEARLLKPEMGPDLFFEFFSADEFSNSCEDFLNPPRTNIWEALKSIVPSIEDANALLEVFLEFDFSSRSSIDPSFWNTVVDNEGLIKTVQILYGNQFLQTKTWQFFYQIYKKYGLDVIAFAIGLMSGRIGQEKIARFVMQFNCDLSAFQSFFLEFGIKIHSDILEIIQETSQTTKGVQAVLDFDDKQFFKRDGIELKATSKEGWHKLLSVLEKRQLIDGNLLEEIQAVFIDTPRSFDFPIPNWKLSHIKLAGDEKKLESKIYFFSRMQ